MASINRMVFAREPLLPPASTSLTFDNPTITQAIFTENNGIADLTVTANAPLLATFSNSGRTIMVAAIPPASSSRIIGSLHELSSSSP